MSKFANNPQTFINGYISAIRNVFLLTTIGITIYGFSKTFKKKSSEETMRIFSSILYLYTIVYLLNTNLLFRKYLNYFDDKKNEQNQLPEYISLKHLRIYEYLTWIYLMILIIIVGLSVRRYF